MVSKRCGCASDSCSCVVTGGVGITVGGSGSKTDPYILDASVEVATLDVQDDNTLIRSGVALIDFQGSGVTVTPGDAGEVVVTVPGSTPGAILARAAGTATIPAPSALNTPTSVAVTFPAGRFVAAPVVVATAGVTGDHTRGPIGVASITATGCTFWVTQTAGALTAATVYWQAVAAG